MQKVQPRILSGFMELLPPDQILFNQMRDTIRSVYEKFGFLPLDTPVIEYSEVLLAKAGGETEKQIYRFNKGDNDLSLRFDLTVPLARYVSEHKEDIAFPFKRYQIGKVFRGERPQKGRFREFYQCDIDVVGNGELSLIYDAEMPVIIYNIFKQLDFGPFVIRINNRKILNGFFASLNLTNEASDILRVIDKIDKIGQEAIRKELSEMALDSAIIDKILTFINIKGTNDEILVALEKMGVKDETYLLGVEELKEVINHLRTFQMPEACYQIDLTIARGLDYYTGTVYETNLKDYPALGSICSGGRYDNLTGYYTDEVLPGIGISIGLTRLFSQLKDQEIINSERKCLLDALIIPMDDSCVNYAIELASYLRQNDHKTDIYYGMKSIKAKMKYANRLAVPYAIIIGTEEVANRTLTLKNMQTGDQESVDFANIVDKIR